MLKKIQDHFKKPEGIIGKIVGKTMAWENKTLNEWTLKQFDIHASKEILEVGYGPGYALDMITDSEENVHIDGMDVAKTMQDEASRRLPSEVRKGEVSLFVGDVAECSFPFDHYDVVFSVNNYTLWENKRKGLLNIYSTLVHNGKIVITMQPRQEDAKDNQAQIFAKDIHDDLSRAGFRCIDVHYKRMNPETAVCVTARK